MDPSAEPAPAAGARPDPVVSPAPDGPAAPAEPVGEDYERLLADAERVLDEVDEALVRLADGAYGVCEVCAGAIDDALLAATPTARTCGQHLPLADPAA